jgi:cysteine sulfinate desulfinase/cysteine desulfurase-like protein
MGRGERQSHYLLKDDSVVLNNSTAQSLPNTLGIAFTGVAANRLAIQIGDEACISTGKYTTPEQAEKSARVIAEAVLLLRA